MPLLNILIITKLIYGISHSHPIIRPTMPDNYSGHIKILAEALTFIGNNHHTSIKCGKCKTIYSDDLRDVQVVHIGTISAESLGILPMIYGTGELRHPLPCKTMLCEGDTNNLMVEVINFYVLLSLLKPVVIMLTLLPNMWIEYVSRIALRIEILVSRYINLFNV